MKKATKMVEEISKQKKLTQPVKEKVVKKIFLNVWLSIGIIVSFGIICLIYALVPEQTASIILKVLAMVSILITVSIFEVAYQKDNVALGVIGIEALVCSIVVLYVPQIYKYKEELMIYQIFVPLPIICALYYVFKSFVNYTIIKREYENSLSDVREILKENDE